MKTVGDRIRQAREFRGLSGEELAFRVGYKTQSGISNLENRATGNGGNKLPQIAQALDFSLEWFLQGPDTDDMRTVPPYRSGQASYTAPGATPAPATQETASSAYMTPRQRAHALVDQLSLLGLTHAIELLEGLVSRHPGSSGERAGIPLPAQAKRVA